MKVSVPGPGASFQVVPPREGADDEVVEESLRLCVDEQEENGVRPHVHDEFLVQRPGLQHRRRDALHGALEHQEGCFF